MLVVADSSPLIVLIHIEHVGILPSLFGEVVIPPEVSAGCLPCLALVEVLEHYLPACQIS